MKKRIIVIGGGETFSQYKDYIAFLRSIKIDLKRSKKKDWKANLQQDLGNRYEVTYINMPNKLNAQYLEWKIWFDKYREFVNKNTILIGHSLGGLFLNRYLHDNPLDLKKLMLVASPFYDCGDFKVPPHFQRLRDYGDKVFIYHSQDDKIVSSDNFLSYISELASSNVDGKLFSDRGHFLQQHFPEIIRDIKR